MVDSNTETVLLKNLFGRFVNSSDDRKFIRVRHNIHVSIYSMDKIVKSGKSAEFDLIRGLLATTHHMYFIWVGYYSSETTLARLDKFFAIESNCKHLKSVELRGDDDYSQVPASMMRFVQRVQTGDTKPLSRQFPALKRLEL